MDYWIRTDVPFHNGDLVTAEDVKFSLDRYLDPDVVGPEWAAINDRFLNRAEIVAADHIRMYFDEWNWAYALSTSGAPVVPKKYIENLVANLGKVEGWTAWAEQPVTTGAFKVVDWERDSYVHLVKAFDEHFYHGVPPFDEAYVYVVVEPSTRLAQLKAGEVDIANIPPSNVLDVKNDPKLSLVWSKYSSPWCVRFYDVFTPETPSPLQDPDVRKAIKLGIDREGIAENVFQGAFEPWGSFYPPYHIGYRERDPDPYDPTEAKRLLTEAGYPDGFDIVFSYPLDRQAESLAVIASLAQVGIRAEAKGYEPTTWATMLWNNQHVGMGYIHQPWWAGSSVFDIGDFVNGWGAQGTRWSPEIRAAWEAQNAATTEEEYTQTCQAAEDVLFGLDCQMVVWAVHGAYGYTNKTIKSWEPTQGSELDQSLFRVTLKEYL
jgi:peptide/nickel transport system substrate-binding protein